jgi:serine/threonine protein kinase
MIGTMFADRYKIISCLGQGGMSVVYQAIDTAEKNSVAVKVLLPGKLFDVKSLLRFQREALTASSVDHHNIVEVYAFDVLDDGKPYIVMEYLPGKSLAELIKESGSLPVTRSIDIIIQTCNALEHAHQRNIIHRDLKPSNIVILPNDDGSDLVKIVDFGIAKLLSDSRSGQETVTQSGDVIGTPNYMSLEQCLGKELDARTDIYSLGCVLFEMLTGTPPFLGDSIVSLAMQQQKSKPPTLKEASLGKGFPQALEEMTVTLLACNLNDRYQSMQQVRQDLLAITIDRGHGDINCPSKPAQPPKRPGAAWKIAAVALACLSVGAVSICLNNPSGTESTLQPGKPAAVKPDNSHTQAGEASAQLRAMIARDPHVKTLRLGATGVGNDDLKLLRYAPHLINLDLELTAVTDSGLKHLENLPLETLQLGSLDISDEGVRHLAHIKSLVELGLADTKITDASLPYIASLPNLHVLTLRHTHISNDHIGELVKLKSLVDLELSNTPISDAGIEKISHLPNLQLLTLRGLHVTRIGLQHLTACPHLRLLNLILVPSTDDDLTPLVKMPELSRLSLEGGQFTDRALDILDKCEHLKLLDLDRCHHITGKRVRQFQIAHPSVLVSHVTSARFADSPFQPQVKQPDAGPALAAARAKLKTMIDQNPGMTILQLGGTEIGDDDLRLLSKVPHLTTLDLQLTKVTDNGLKHLENLPLTTLILDYLDITDEGVRHLSRIKTLANLTLNDTKISDKSLPYLASLPNLYWLYLEQTGISNEHIGDLATLKRLAVLDISGTPISDPGIEKISHIANLRILTLRGTPVTRIGLKYLTHCPLLFQLELTDSPLKDDDLAPVVKIPRLTRFSIENGKFTDRALDILDGCKHLEFLSLDRCPNLTDKRVREFQRTHPRTVITHITQEQFNDPDFQARWRPKM